MAMLIKIHAANMMKIPHTKAYMIVEDDKGETYSTFEEKHFPIFKKAAENKSEIECEVKWRKYANITSITINGTKI